MLDSNLKTQLKTYLAKLQRPIELIASLDDRPASQDMLSLLDDIGSLSEMITVRTDGQFERRPSFQVTAVGADMGVHFAAVPLGHEFTSLVLALLQAGGHPPKVEAELIDQIRSLDRDLSFETVMSLSCHNCPDVVQALNLMAVLNPRVRHVAVDGSLFAQEVEARQIMAVPSIFLGGRAFGSGRLELAQILASVDQGAQERDARRLSGQAPYDVLVVGGGPAGAAAAVYAARKGIRTGLVAERFGGQTLDTLGIENFISVPRTEGPAFAAALEAHVRAYEVDLMKGQRAAALQPALEPGGLATLTLTNGAQLKARSVVLAPGARWRDVGVPGEQEYRTRGVAYCPHCDGPLFKGKRVAVIGGGNSGVEAAIDLAGVVTHVTLLEFADVLKADAVLVRKLESLPNVTVHLNAQTTQIVGDGQKVTALRWRDRSTGSNHSTELSGVFVQIGLMPNTDWLRSTLPADAPGAAPANAARPAQQASAVELSRHGEIIIDARCATSAPGIFAAGDATTVPYKQIIVASGEGAKAALSAFDHVIRHTIA